MSHWVLNLRCLICIIFLFILFSIFKKISLTRPKNRIKKTKNIDLLCKYSTNTEPTERTSVLYGKSLLSLQFVHRALCHLIVKGSGRQELQSSFKSLSNNDGTPSMLVVLCSGINENKS